MKNEPEKPVSSSVLGRAMRRFGKEVYRAFSTVGAPYTDMFYPPRTEEASKQSEQAGGDTSGTMAATAEKQASALANLLVRDSHVEKNLTSEQHEEEPHASPQVQAKELSKVSPQPQSADVKVESSAPSRAPQSR